MASNGKNDPEWFEWVQKGDFPLLSSAELEYIAEVRQSIIKEYRSKPTPRIPQNQRLKNKLSVMKNNFEDVVTYLKESADRKEYFVANYPPWRSIRDMTVSQLKNIAVAVDKNKKENAAVIGGGSSLSIAGGLLCLVPGIAAIRFAGSVIMALGTVSAIAASVSEAQVLQQKLKEVERVMQEDKTFSEKLWEWVNDASHMEEAYKTITDIEVDGTLKKTAIDLYDIFKKGRKSELSMRIRKSLEYFNVPPTAISDIADVITILIATYMLYKRFRALFTQAFEAYNCKSALLNIACNVIAGTTVAASIVNATRSPNFTFKKSRIGMGIIENIFNIIQAIKAEESVCVESAEIDKAAKKLQKEAEVFEKVYYAVRQA